MAKGPLPHPLELERRRLMAHNRLLYDYIEALVAARELKRGGDDASGALDGHCAANRLYASRDRWRRKVEQLRSVMPAEFTEDEVVLPGVFDLARRYWEARGLPWRTWGSRVKGDKFREESRELRRALRRYNRAGYGGVEVQHEVGDVAITLAWIAHCFGTSVEECMELKTQKDAGRGPGPHYKAGK